MSQRISYVDLAYLKAHIETSISVLARQVRLYVAGQKQLWQQIPYLALEANGRSGFASDEQPWMSKLWTLHKPGDGAVFIDLVEAKIVNSEKTEVSDNLIIPLLNCLADFDAQAIIDRLTEEASMPYKNGYDPATNDALREEIRAKYNVQKYSTS